MRRTRALLAVIASALALTACGETVNIGENGVAQGITVQATGYADVVPDAVRASLSVSVLAQTNDEALAEASRVADIVRMTLKDLKVDDADIATQTLSVNPEYSYSDTEGQKLVGYRATQVFDVLIRAAKDAGSVIDAVVSRGGANVSVNGVNPIVDDATDAATVAREDAVKKARAKAEAYAELLGAELGDLVYLTEVSAPTNFAVGAKSDGVAESAATVIDLGTQQVSVTIEVRWKTN